MSKAALVSAVAASAFVGYSCLCRTARTVRESRSRIRSFRTTTGVPLRCPVPRRAACPACTEGCQAISLFLCFSQTRPAACLVRSACRPKSSASFLSFLAPFFSFYSGVLRR